MSQGLIPILFPGFMCASEATDVGPHDGRERETSPAGLTDTTSGGNALTCDVPVAGSLVYGTPRRDPDGSLTAHC